MTGTTFARQPGEGYFSRERLFLIEKSCAGINFMIAAFGMLVLALLHRVDSRTSAARVLRREPAGELRGGRAGQHRADCVAHVARRASGRACPRFSAADVHRLEGIAVYFGGLVLLYELVQRLDRRVCPEGRAS